MSQPLISVVSPVYKAEKIVPELVARIKEAVKSITEDFEIILVEDRSPDLSWDAIKGECVKDHRVKGIRFSKNFGQHFAITAGLSASKGHYIVVMDCDLQDNPKYIATLYQAALKGSDIVLTYKDKRKHGFLKNFTASLFFKVFNYLVENKEYDANKNIGAYSLLSRKAVDAYLSFRESQRHYLNIIRMIGFKKSYINIQHERRFEGKSSYTFSKLLKHAMVGITSQSDKLLRLSISVGFIMCFLSAAWGVVILYRYFATGLLSGYASIMLFQILSTGFILISIGIAGIYIGKIFEQVKERPLYIIEESENI